MRSRRLGLDGHLWDSYVSRFLRKRSNTQGYFARSHMLWLGWMCMRVFLWQHSYRFVFPAPIKEFASRIRMLSSKLGIHFIPVTFWKAETYVETWYAYNQHAKGRATNKSRPCSFTWKRRRPHLNGFVCFRICFNCMLIGVEYVQVVLCNSDLAVLFPV